MRIDPDDLIDDRTLDRVVPRGLIDSKIDSLGHQSIASQIAAIAELSSGSTNIAVFGPWGSGKSSLVALIRQALNQAPPAKRRRLVVFDAWRSTGENFQINFLSEISRAISARLGKGIQRRLFESRRTLSLPFGLSSWPRGVRFAVLALLIVAVTLIAPIVYTLSQVGWQWDALKWTAVLENVKGWFSWAVSGTLILAVVGVASDVTRASVEEVAPNEVTQFRDLFNSLLWSRRRYVIFIDELDRCSPKAVIEVLSGMRTFLDHKKVTFVAAFDRAAVESAIFTEVKKEMTVNDPSGYFTTSGEYLDKIFQYQLSLPPQTAQSHRRMAAALVADRKGIWAELRESLGVGANDVLALLSPIHVVSLRRTKVLLNDFAINARSFQDQLGPTWASRASEIAVHTVLSTEFPELSQDMIREPDLPSYLINPSRIPSRRALSDLVRLYRSGKKQLDGAADQSLDEEETEALLAVQWQTLERYLLRVNSMGISFPRPDITLMTASPLADRFEDPGLYSAVTSAPDEDAAITLEILASASASDVHNAVAYLLQETEGLSPRESQRVATVVGEILARDNFELPPLRRVSLRALWKRANYPTSGAVWLTEKALEGFMKELARVEYPDELARIFSDASDLEIPYAGALAIAVRTVPDRYSERALRALEPWVQSSIDQNNRALVEFVTRVKPGGWVQLENSLQSLAAGPTAEVEPVTPGSAAIATTARNEAAVQIAEATRKVRQSSILSAMSEIWALPSSGFELLLWTASMLHLLADEIEEAGELLDDLVKQIDARMRQRISLALLARFPADLAGHWTISDIDSTLSDELSAAWLAVVKAASGAAAGDRDDLAVSLHDLSSQQFARPIGPEAIAWIESWARSIDPSADAPGFRFAASAVRDAHSVGLDPNALRHISVELYAKALELVDDPDDFVPFMQELRNESDQVVSAVLEMATAADTSIGEPLIRARLALTAIHTTVARGRRGRQLPLRLSRSAMPGAPRACLINVGSRR
jgi:hypothetical protein